MTTLDPAVLTPDLPVATRRSPRRWELRVGIALFVVLVGGSFVAPLFLQNPLTQNLLAAYQPPGAVGHLLGTDPLGHDVLAWIAGGIRAGTEVSVGVLTLAGGIGVTVGLLAGYHGGAVDVLLMRLADLQLAIPALVLFVSASAVITPSMLSLIILISAVSWVPYARLVRSRVLSERERGYIAAAELAGASRRRVLIRHLARSCAATVVVFATLQVAQVFVIEASLSFLGLGLQPPATSLGVIIQQARSNLAGLWWCAVFPGAALLLIVLSANLIGDGLRSILTDQPSTRRP